jgi:hypothetical protein
MSAMQSANAMLEAVLGKKKSVVDENAAKARKEAEMRDYVAKQLQQFIEDGGLISFEDLPGALEERTRLLQELEQHMENFEEYDLQRSAMNEVFYAYLFTLLAQRSATDISLSSLVVYHDMVVQNGGPNQRHPRLPESDKAKASKTQMTSATLSPLTISAMVELAALHQELPLLLDQECETWGRSPWTFLTHLGDEKNVLHGHLERMSVLFLGFFLIVAVG